ncbi:hypothetical protein CPC08DRAFT_726167 [Agrocybe pediades]|nr:hypothetical protein CPC08DRAFT_726167 [Agrocybe pediades]
MVGPLFQYRLSFEHAAERVKSSRVQSPASPSLEEPTMALSPGRRGGQRRHSSSHNCDSIECCPPSSRAYLNESTTHAIGRYVAYGCFKTCMLSESSCSTLKMPPPIPPSRSFHSSSSAMTMSPSTTFLPPPTTSASTVVDVHTYTFLTTAWSTTVAFLSNFCSCSGLDVFDTDTDYLICANANVQFRRRCFRRSIFDTLDKSTNYPRAARDGLESPEEAERSCGARAESLATTWAVVCEELKDVREDDSDVKMEVDRDLHEREDEQRSSSPVLSGMDVGGRRRKKVPLDVNLVTSSVQTLKPAKHDTEAHEEGGDGHGHMHSAPASTTPTRKSTPVVTPASLLRVWLLWTCSRLTKVQLARLQLLKWVLRHHLSWILSMCTRKRRKKKSVWKERGGIEGGKGASAEVEDKAVAKEVRASQVVAPFAVEKEACCPTTTTTRSGVSSRSGTNVRCTFHIRANADFIGTPRPRYLVGTLPNFQEQTIKPETTSSDRPPTLARQEPLARSSPSSRLDDDKPIIPPLLGQIRRPLSLMFDINWAAAFAFTMSLPPGEQ